MMRVAVISAHTCPLAVLGGRESGGLNVYVRETCRELGRRGIAVDIFTRSQDPALPREVELAPGVRVLHIRAGPEAPYDKYRLLKHLPDFVGGVLERAVADYDVIHSHYWISGVAAMELKAVWEVPLVHMYHTLGCLKNRVARSQIERERSIRLYWERKIAERSDALIASQPLERAQLIWHYSAPSRAIRVIPCGVDLSLFSPVERSRAREALGLDPRFWLLFVGRLDPIKGLDTLLRALRLLRKRGLGKDGSRRPALLIIGGDGGNGKASDAAVRIEEQAKALGLQDDVFLLGPKPQASLPLYYASAEAFVLPSRYESFGIVALEAMACGTPVIASRVGGLSYTVREGITGFLIPEGDAVSLADRIEKLYHEPSLGDAMGRSALSWVGRFGWGGVVDSILHLYQSLCAEEDLEALFMQNVCDGMRERARP